MSKNYGRLGVPNLDTSPMPQPPQPSARRKRRKWPWVLLAVGVLFVIFAAVAGGGGALPRQASPAGSVVYKVASDASTVSATYATLKDGKVQEAQNNNVVPPWSTSVPADRGLAHGYYSLVAQMTPAGAGGHDGTTISCSITVNGKIIADNTSTGQYAVVTCTG